MSASAMGPLEVTAWGDYEMLCRPCVDCGQFTGMFCDICRAADRIPDETWAPGQMTPLCSTCDRQHGRCNFCRGVKWCRPPAWRR